MPAVPLHRDGTAIDFQFVYCEFFM